MQDTGGRSAREGEAAGSFFQASLYLNHINVMGNCTFNGDKTCMSKPLVHLQIIPSMYKSLLGEHKSYPNNDKPHMQSRQARDKEETEKKKDRKPSNNHHHQKNPNPL